ncbi:MAG: gliding motility-associated C-terminal domain-containing protein [Flavobacteriales bacterium]|nr:gliding motility-associated C-terminal domain-containing protein [Flavobacteriales bacterium]
MLSTKAQQSSCPNTGFEDGTFANWQAFTGWCCPINANTMGLANGRHTIMTGPGMDANTNNNVPVVAPGGGVYSARLGNDQTGSEAERLRYSMVVDANNSLFLYRYAVVLEDPAHDDAEQPRFQIRMFNQNNQPIDCGLYDVTASAGIPGFQTVVNQFGSTVVYKNWTTVGMDLTPYIGQTVTIEFATGDCSLGGHYGYAYLDCYCSPLQITSDFCPGSLTTTLSAPTGFTSYAWSTGATTPSITIVNPIEGQTYTVTLTSVTGCTVTLTSVLTPAIVASGFASVGECMNNVQFTDNSSVISGPAISNWLWNFGDGTTSTLQNPVHSFDSPGDHTVTLVVYSAADCPDTLVQTINLLPSPIVDFSFTPPCLGEQMTFTNNSVLGNAMSQLRWDFGDGSPISTLSNPSHVFSPAGTYNVELYISDVLGCSDSLTLPVTITPLPTVNIGPDQVTCANQPVVLNAANAGSTYLWSTGQTTQSITPVSSGNHWVIVTLPNGCANSDTALVTLNPIPIDVLDNLTACIEDPVVLDAQNTGCTYLWNTGATSQSITINAAPGNYTVVITTPLGCTITDGAQVAFAPSVSVNLGPDQLLCDQEVAVANAGVFPNAAYLWSDGSTNQTLSVTQSGPVGVTVTNGYCSASDTVGYLFYPLPVLTLTDTALCIEQTLTLDAGNAGSTYLWSTGATTQSITLAETSGWYGVAVTTPDGCIDSVRVQVSFIPSIVLDLGPDSILCRGESLVLDAYNPNSVYQWSDGITTFGRVVSNSQNLIVNVNNGYCYGSDTISVLVVENPLPVLVNAVDVCFEDPRVQLTLDGSPTGTFIFWSTGDTTRSIVVRDYGQYIVEALNPPRCVKIDTIQVREHCPPRVFIPNTFTPDNDGTNDFFIPVSYNVSTIDFKIFNRWGEIVFETDSHGKGWDGYHSGKVVPDGVYNYRFTFKPYIDSYGGMGNEEVLTGHVTVLR